MLKYGLLFTLTFLACSFVNAQGLIKGRVFEAKTRITLTDIKVLDANNKQVVLTDNNGRYTIRAKVGDILIFSGFSYEADTVLVTDMHEKEISLLPKGNMLVGVTINSNAVTAPSTFKNTDPEFQGQTVNYQRDNNGNYKGGLAIKLFDSHSGEKKREHLAKLFADDKTRDEIATAFNAKTVAKYVPLKGKELDDFVALYTPTEAVFTDKNFVMVNYINTCYKKFIKLPADKRHVEKIDN